MSIQPKAIIIGCTGQDGSYLADLLLSKGYEVHGIVRRCSQPRIERLQHIIGLITLHGGDITDQGSMLRLMVDIHPDEVYNLAAQSFVHESWNSPVATGDMTAIGVTRVLEAIRQTNHDIKFYQASSSEMFGKVVETPQTENTPFHPRSPYGIAKLYGHWMTINYRESFNMFCVSGILFNHESPRRGLEFVTRKITRAAAMIKHGKQDKLFLGNLDAKRDWGYAGDYVYAMWNMLQQDEPTDYVISTGVMHSVRDFVIAAFERVDLDYKKYVEVDPKFYRPVDINILCGDSSKAKKELGWEPKVAFEELVQDMVSSDMDEVAVL